MADKIFTIKKGEKITIVIAKPKNSTAARIVPFKSQGIIKSRRETDYLPRRRKAAGINFYDLGQILEDEVFVTNPAALMPEISVFSELLIVTDETDDDKINLIAEIENIIFDVETENWKTDFFKIQKGNLDFEKSIELLIGIDQPVPFFGSLDETEKWTEKGLVLTNQEAATLVVNPNGVLYSVGSINFANLAASNITKITSVRDPEAEAVEFTPSTSMDIFLMPSAQVSQGYANYIDGLHTTESASDFIKKADYLNYFWSVFDRSLWSQFIELSESDGLTAYESAYRLWQILRQFPNSRARRLIYDFEDEPPHPYSTVMETLAPNDFPLSSIYTDTPEPTVAGTYSYNNFFGVNMTNDLFSLQKLKFIIRQGGQLFYFWYIE